MAGDEENKPARAYQRRLSRSMDKKGAAKPDLAHMKRRILAIISKHDVIRAGIFGSYARGEAKKSSDLDLLIQFRGSKSLLDLIGLKQELEDGLGVRVDCLTYKSIHPKLKDRILGEEVRIK